MQTIGGGGTPDGDSVRRPSATLHDVAREAGVSVATASRALNGSPSRRVRQENIARVLAAAAKLDYQPHQSAQAIARGSTRTAALVVRGIDDPFFAPIAAGVAQGAEPAGLIVTMAVADRSTNSELQVVRTLRGHRPRAIILAASRVERPACSTREALLAELSSYRSAGGSVVLISPPDLPFHTVGIDNSGGAQRLALALVELGYRRFAVIHAGAALRTSRDRHTGFLAGLRQADITVDDRFVVEAETTREGGYRAARDLAERGLVGPAAGPGDRAEAVFAVNDMMAIGAMTAFRDAGLVPGDDIAVAGFDGIRAAVDVAPELTTVAIPLEQVGSTAMELALRPDATPARAQLPTRVVLRASTPPLTAPARDTAAG